MSKKCCREPLDPGLALYSCTDLLCQSGCAHLSNALSVSVARVGLATHSVIDLMRDVLLQADLIYCDHTFFGQVLKLMCGAGRCPRDSATSLATRSQQTKSVGRDEPSTWSRSGATRH